MCDTILAFGENDSYHFECPSGWCQSNLPKEIAALFKEGIVAETYNMSLGTNDGFVFSYKTKFHDVRLTSKNIPQVLKDWLYAKDAHGDCIRGFGCLHVSLGADGKSFWATDGKEYIWNALPADLTTALSGLLKNGQWTDTPRLITLGAGGDYFMLTMANVCHWRLTNYGALNSQVPAFRDSQAFNMVRNLALSPHKPGACAVVLENGASFAEGMRASAAAHIQAMQKAIQSDTEALYQRQQQQLQETNRTIHSLNQAAALMDAQAARAGQLMDLCNLEYECTGCGRHAAYCICGNLR